MLPKKAKPSGFPIFLRRIQGESMLPKYRPGKIVVCTRRFRIVYPGDVIIFLHEGREKIKRVRAVKQEHVYVIGDNPTGSTDSRHHGWIHIDAIVAVVL